MPTKAAEEVLAKALKHYVDGLGNLNGDHARDIGLADYTGTNPQRRFQIYALLANVCGFLGTRVEFPEIPNAPIKIAYPSKEYTGFLHRGQARRTVAVKSPESPVPDLVSISSDEECDEVKAGTVVDVIEISDNDYAGDVLTPPHAHHEHS